MDEPHKKAGDLGHKTVAIDKLDGDIIVVSSTPKPPDIPKGKGRHCPQCGAQAWLLSRHCWHCRYDFGRRTIPTGHKMLFMAAVCQLAAALAGLMHFYANLAGPG